jgi:hypothetical protein
MSNPLFDVEDSKELPTILGGRLGRFKSSSSRDGKVHDIKYLARIGQHSTVTNDDSDDEVTSEGAHAQVFKVRIDSKIFALKIVRLSI